MSCLFCCVLHAKGSEVVESGVEVCGGEGSGVVWCGVVWCGVVRCGVRCSYAGDCDGLGSLYGKGHEA